MSHQPGFDFETQISAHRAAILGYVRSIVGDPATAEDLTQETLLRAHDRRETLKDEARLVAWLYRIATNLCRDRFRRQQSHGKPGPKDIEPYDAVEQVHPVAAAGPRLDQALEQDEMSSCVQSYLAGLPDTYKAAILLHDMEELTNPEIARMLGISLPTVKIRIHRAREKLREALAGGCSFSSDERGVLVCRPKGDGQSSDEKGD
jgi:RNA polymerase sigma-70 factor (ECF subfamily)